MKALLYVRVSTREQADTRLGLDAQRRGLVAEAERRGWTYEIVEDAGFTGRNDNRPGLQRALTLLRRHEADVLMVYRLDRVSRSVQDFARLLDRANRQRWALIAQDMGIDLTSPNGRLVAHILVAVAQWESELVGLRTSEAMAEAKTRGATFGRERMASPETVERIGELRGEGRSFAGIAQQLDADDVPTPNGGARWYGSTVSRIYNSTQEPACSN